MGTIGKRLGFLFVLWLSVPYSMGQDGIRKRILVFGDSLTAGYGLGKEFAFPALIQKKIDAAGLTFEMVNGGVSGDTSAGGLRRLGWNLKGRLDVLILELGANDGLRGIDTTATEQNLQAIIDQSRTANPDIALIIAGMTLPPNLGQGYVGRFERVYADLAERNGEVLIPFLLEGVAGNPDLNQADGIHPTAKGHEIIAETVWHYLEPVLREIGGS